MDTARSRRAQTGLDGWLGAVGIFHLPLCACSVGPLVFARWATRRCSDQVGSTCEEELQFMVDVLVRNLNMQSSASDCGGRARLAPDAVGTSCRGLSNTKWKV